MIVIAEGKPGEGMTYQPPSNNDFQIRFRQVRKDLKLTQKAMAENLQVSLRTVQRYENGTASPDAVILERLSRLGIDLHCLITGENFSNEVIPCRSN